MRPAAITSPFCAMEYKEDWVHWKKDQPLSGLQEEKQTEHRYAENEQTAPEHADAASTLPYIMPIQRPQYNAVLDRFSNARKQSGAFTAWKA